MKVKVELDENESHIQGLKYLPLSVKAYFELADWSGVSESLRDHIIDQLGRGNQPLINAFTLCFPQALWGKLVNFLDAKGVFFDLNGEWGILSVNENRDIVGQCRFYVLYEVKGRENLVQEIEENLLDNTNYLRETVAFRINEGKLIRILARG